MVRSQILLRPDQRLRLQELARSEGRSLSDVTRRAIDAGLATFEEDADESVRRTMAALDALGAMRQRAEQRIGVYPGDVIAEVRAERERQFDHVERGE